jgi:hypothetical protein
MVLATGRSSRGAMCHTCRTFTSPQAPLVAMKLAERHMNTTLRVKPPAGTTTSGMGRLACSLAQVVHGPWGICIDLPYLVRTSSQYYHICFAAQRKVGCKILPSPKATSRTLTTGPTCWLLRPLCMISHHIWVAWSLTLHAAPRSQVKVTKPSVKPRTLAADHPAPVRP